MNSVELKKELIRMRSAETDLRRKYIIRKAIDRIDALEYAIKDAAKVAMR